MTAGIPSRAAQHRRSVTGRFDVDYAWRVAFIFVLTAVAFWRSVVNTIVAAVDGSRVAYLVLVPILAVMITARYRHVEVRGVSDRESDWIISLCSLFGVVGGVYVMGQRLPAAAALWRVDLLLGILWLICVAVLVTGARSVQQRWRLWLFVLISGNSFAYLITASWLGGSDVIVVMMADIIGVVAFYLAAHDCAHRPAATALVALIAIGSGVALSGTTILIATMISAGMVPLIGTVLTVALTRPPALAHPRPAKRFPAHTVVSFGVLCVFTLVLALWSPIGGRIPSPWVPTVADNWVASAGLTQETTYSFAPRLFGTGATWTRYRVTDDVKPTAAVDVASAPTLGALRDYSQAVWYSRSAPIQFVRTHEPAARKLVVTSADSPEAEPGVGGWYLLTWIWHVDGGPFQRVIIVVNQDLRAAASPPAPQPVTLRNSMAAPLSWLLRQQPASDVTVDQRVIERAQTIAEHLVTASGEQP